MIHLFIFFLNLINLFRVPALANLPTPQKALLGKVPQGTETWNKIAKEAARLSLSLLLLYFGLFVLILYCRTVPPRENGGNCDIKNLSKGSRVYLLPCF